MKKLFILITYSLTWVFVGYVIANIGTIEAKNQRDRLADYVHQYMDSQYEASLDSTQLISLEEAIKSCQEEDNSHGDLGFYMDSDNWSFAY